jgi:hypothetical protein
MPVSWQKEPVYREWDWLLSFFFACVVYYTVDYVCLFGIEVDCFYIDVSFFCFYR